MRSAACTDAGFRQLRLDAVPLRATSASSAAASDVRACSAELHPSAEALSPARPHEHHYNCTTDYQYLGNLTTGNQARSAALRTGRRPNKQAKASILRAGC